MLGQDTRSTTRGAFVQWAEGPVDDTGFGALSTYRRRSGETSYLHFVKTASVPMAPYVTTLNFHDISNVHVQVRNWRYEVSPLRRRYIPARRLILTLQHRKPGAVTIRTINSSKNSSLVHSRRLFLVENVISNSFEMYGFRKKHGAREKLASEIREIKSYDRNTFAEQETLNITDQYRPFTRITSLSLYHRCHYNYNDCFRHYFSSTRLSCGAARCPIRPDTRKLLFRIGREYFNEPPVRRKKYKSQLIRTLSIMVSFIGTQHPECWVSLSRRSLPFRKFLAEGTKGELQLAYSE
ncbi:unnamed protein product [Nesidiocoris tenuis]|uniref:Uncharacterized protein n=1 Tax=Nesidiocoris tenuis TaxID=355587 RepID=A0A6H5H7A6_9HEMI|nr:unnamed protein product [Nesidiocoris tenuis]